MQHLVYARSKLMEAALLGLAMLPFPVVIGIDEGIASGHRIGLVGTPLYLIGPAGRWLVVAGLMIALLARSIRCFALLQGDRVALAATSAGLTARTLWGVRHANWDAVLRIELLTQRSRGWTRRWVCVRTATPAETSWRIPVQLLEGSDSEVRRWMEEARALQIQSLARGSTPPIVAQARFGRRRSGIG